MSEPQENDSAAGARWGWAIAIAIALALLAWGLANYAFVRDAPREWNFGALDDTPARSIYSTTEPARSPQPPAQFPLPPEAQKKVSSPAPPSSERKGATP